LKIETGKYDSIVTQLKDLGEVQSFSENQNDLTGQYTNNQVEIAAAKSRLERYQQLYKDAKDVNEKLSVSDRIFDQERTVKYLDDMSKNIDQRVEYSTVYFTITEKRSDYADVVFVKFSELIQKLVASLNSLLSFVFWILPWALVGGIGLFLWKKYRK
jgi:hypothetical protein